MGLLIFSCSKENDLNNDDNNNNVNDNSLETILQTETIVANSEQSENGILSISDSEMIITLHFLTIPILKSVVFW